MIYHAFPTAYDPLSLVCSSIMPCYKKQWEADRIDMQTPDGARSAAPCLLPPLPLLCLPLLSFHNDRRDRASLQCGCCMPASPSRPSGVLDLTCCREVDHVVTTKQLGAWLQREGIDYPKLGESLHIDAPHGWRAAAFCISCLQGWLKSILLQQSEGLAVQAGRATHCVRQLPLLAQWSPIQRTPPSMTGWASAPDPAPCTA